MFFDFFFLLKSKYLFLKNNYQIQSKGYGVHLPRILCTFFPHEVPPFEHLDGQRMYWKSLNFANHLILKKINLSF